MVPDHLQPQQARRSSRYPQSTANTINMIPHASQPYDDSSKASGKKKGGLKWSASAKRLLLAKRSWLTNTKFFQRAIDSAFDSIDVDKSGDVTLEELHAGLLLIHLKMAMYVGAPACRVRVFAD